MKLIKAGERDGLGGKTGSQFTGEVFNYLSMGATDGVTINTVNFTPGARTFWHHHSEGQILIVVAGRGRTQVEGGEVVEISQGDIVWIPAGERHWHGGGEDSFMTHIAISLGPTVWAEPVPDPTYSGAPGETDAAS
jgi:quercetin dioxygenase-like cupin family protein